MVLNMLHLCLMFQLQTPPTLNLHTLKEEDVIPTKCTHRIVWYAFYFIRLTTSIPTSRSKYSLVKHRNIWYRYTHTVQSLYLPTIGGNDYVRKGLEVWYKTSPHKIFPQRILAWSFIIADEIYVSLITELIEKIV